MFERLQRLVERISGRRLMRNPATVIASATEAMGVVLSTGQISLIEARALGGLVRGADPERPIIEIGTLFGWSTLVMTLSKADDQEVISG